LNILKAIVFDWGDTVMRDFPEYKGPMATWPKVEKVEGIENALNFFHKNLTCCLASNAGDSDAESMGLALSRVNLRQHFHYLFTSLELQAKKPDPMFYLEILRRLEFEPEQCVVIGNDYQKDIVPAKSIGMITIWFTQQPDSRSAAYVDYSIDSMDKSISIVERLLKR
jgi:FMN phosphatase YigB (HAD superfamily)